MEIIAIKKILNRQKLIYLQLYYQSVIRENKTFRSKDDIFVQSIETFRLSKHNIIR